MKYNKRLNIIINELKNNYNIYNNYIIIDDYVIKFNVSNYKEIDNKYYYLKDILKSEEYNIFINNLKNNIDINAGVNIKILNELFNDYDLSFNGFIEDIQNYLKTNNNIDNAINYALTRTALYYYEKSYSLNEILAILQEDTEDYSLKEMVIDCLYMSRHFNNIKQLIDNYI